MHSATAMQVAMLAVVWQTPKSTAVIAGAMQIRPKQAASRLWRLELHGYVERAWTQQDGVQWQLTEKGSKLLSA